MDELQEEVPAGGEATADGGDLEDAGETDALEEVSEEELFEAAREDALDFLEGLIDAMEIEGDVAVAIVPGGISASIEGEESGILIGRRGQTLDAIQEILRGAVQRVARARVRVALDVEGYRERRRDALEEEARKMAERALEEGEVELEPMPAFERKIVHDVVGEIEGVTSFSEGEEPRRRVVIARDEG